MRGISSAIAVLIGLEIFCHVAAWSQIPPTELEVEQSLFNIPAKTMGGQQFWTDVHFEGGWHIQRNYVTNHFRLLDPQDVRQAWGTKEQCETELNRVKSQGKLQPYQGKMVILLHGLNRTHRSMDKLANKLRSEHGFQVINFQYASSRGTVQEHARNLANVINGLGPEVTEIGFVAHSLGNLVVRNYLYQLERLESEQTIAPRLTGMVMLGPPNQGSGLARLLRNNLAFQGIAGLSGDQLSNEWNLLASELATPTFPFGIIAGGGDKSNLYERIVFDGPSDLIVAVSETQLPGAAMHIQLPIAHTFMMEDPQVMEITANFLQSSAAR
ncbi:MAG: alpha/beta hydrolase [Planctomycetaceae bacterium]|nr:alpha/beta hydrolase [Planctomycetaceae bacterium]